MMIMPAARISDSLLTQPPLDMSIMLFWLTLATSSVLYSLPTLWNTVEKLCPTACFRLQTANYFPEHWSRSWANEMARYCRERYESDVIIMGQN